MVNGPRVLIHSLSYWILVVFDFLVVCLLMLTCTCLFLSAFLTFHAGDSPRSWCRVLWAHPWEGEHKALFLLLLGRSRHCRSLSKQKAARVPRQARCRISHLTVHRGWDSWHCSECFQPVLGAGPGDLGMFTMWQLCVFGCC